VARKSQIIKCGAHRINPKEIQEVIQDFAGVRDVAVIGVDDELLGEKIKAYVVLQEGAQLNAKSLTSQCREFLPAFKIPHSVVFMEELPKTATGKVNLAYLKKNALP
jgi:acyl-coenzyme A synthetase/AMP-(fatty) acid ligase